MMSGSAALPVHVLERWRDITGHTLLERYGMTEIGMALSNPLDGRAPARHASGMPLPGVDVHLVDEDGIEVPEGQPGEVEVRGPDRVPRVLAAARGNATPRSATAGSAPATWPWWRTATTACSAAPAWTSSRPAASRCRRSRSRRCCARTGDIAECAVVGVADEEWGERVSAAVELKPGASLALDELQAWAKTLLAPYKVPRALSVVDGAAPQRDGQGGQAPGCPPVRIGLRCCYERAAADGLRSGTGAPGGAGRRGLGPALLPGRQLPGEVRAARHARRVVHLLPPGVSQRPDGAVGHRLADRLSRTPKST